MSCRLLFVALVVGADATRLRQMREEPAAEPEGSKIIEGPDCGKVKQIIPMYDKAAKVGKVAGEARGAITTATAAAEEATVASTRAKEIGAVVGNGGELPTAIKSAAEAADTAATDATAAATALETDLTTLKGEISGSDFSGSAVKDMSGVKDKTEAALKAASDAHDAAKRVLEKAQAAESQAMESTDKVASMTKELLEVTAPKIKEAGEVGQKAGWAVDDADAKVAKAADALTKVDTAIGKAGDQAPVLEAFKTKLTGEKEGVSEAATAVTDENTKLTASLEELKTAVQPLEEVQQSAAGGNAVHDVQPKLTAAEAALDTTEEDTANVKAKVATLMKRQARLDAALKEADEKTK